MAQIARITTWASGQVLTAATLNGEFNNLVTAWNNIDSATTSWTTLKVAGAFTAQGQTIVNGQVNAVISNQNGNTQWSVSNSSSGVTAAALLISSNTVASVYLGMNGGSSTATLFGVTLANYAVIDSNSGAAGLLINTEAGPLYLGTASTRALTIDGTSQAVSLRGTQTNNNATAGDVGQAITSGQQSASFPTTNQYGDLASISLTAGDWIISAVFYGNMTAGSGVATLVSVGISTTSGNSATGLTLGDNLLTHSVDTGVTNLAPTSMSISGYRASLSGTTVHYLKFLATYGSGTPTAAGRISAVRIR